MAVASLRYRPNAAPAYESKAGFVYFSGVPHEYHYWRFRTMLKFETLPYLPEPPTPTVQAAATIPPTAQAAAPTESESGAPETEVVAAPQLELPSTPSGMDAHNSRKRSGNLTTSGQIPCGKLLKRYAATR